MICLHCLQPISDYSEIMNPMNPMKALLMNKIWIDRNAFITLHAFLPPLILNKIQVMEGVFRPHLPSLPSFHVFFGGDYRV